MDGHGIRFGTDGWRGVMCDDFVVGKVELVAQAIADYLLRARDQRPLAVVGHDTRFFAEQFAAACAGVLAGNGVRVLAPARALPTPVVAFAIGQYEANGAIMLTASHNPPVYNGIKFIPEYAGPASPRITSEIEAHLARIQPSGVRKASAFEAEECDPVPSYHEHLKELVDLDALRGLRVALDVMYGAGSGVMREVLLGAGCEVDALHEWRDPLFGGLMPEPNDANLRELKGLIASGGFDLGLALDGDADRFGVVDSNGELLSSNQVLAVIALHLLEERGMRGRIVRTVATTHILDDIASAYDVECVETPVGFKHIASEMLGGGVLLGGEESGGLSVAGHVPEKDGLLADLLVAEVVAKSGRSLGETLRRIYERFGRRVTRRIDVEYPMEAKERLLGELRERPPERIGSLGVLEVRTTDGVKYLMDRGSWILVRPSGTEPLVRAYIEARDETDFAVLEGWVTRLLGTGA
ncbi:MAG: phosphoglucomutase/phosphomannomutase family protein [Actinobacteria bacterium]|nr:MAG: phosphoglucomutase/phosphomannomutase family protein [Actinomycetota bacterium]